jgi:hypothetical protein
VNDLPPDPPRLRAILAYLDRQVAEHETVGMYLRLQRDAVRQAIAAADSKPVQRPRHEQPAPQQRKADRFISERALHSGPTGSQTGVLLHSAGCDMIRKPIASVDAETARAALTKDRIFTSPCNVCRPDTALGILD